ncbi:MULTISPECIES: hypothetical protein [Saccharothrix]|uniref:hypothetical protein n=1 Tax=Saccharothrix TaxID=2071 RepID=UPI0011612344|nr:hypothetical protein [Saccharothrix sp. CB00851]
MPITPAEVAGPVVRERAGPSGVELGRAVVGDGFVPEAGTAFVQREVEVQATSVVPAPAESVAPAPAQDAAPAPGPAVAAPDAEELLKKLYDPLVRRLKAELWLDRERRGALTDRWR